MNRFLKFLSREIKFLRRYFTTSRRWRKYINMQTLLITGVSAVFLTTLAWSAPISAAEKETIHDPITGAVIAGSASAGKVNGDLAINPSFGQPKQIDTPTVAPANPLPLDTETQIPAAGATPTRTPFPPEFQYNSDQTIGISLAATVLILIVSFGVLMFMPKKEKL